MATTEFSPRQWQILEFLAHRRRGAGSGDDWVLLDELAKEFAVYPDHMLGQVFMLEARGLVETPPVPFPIRCRLTAEGRVLLADPPPGDDPRPRPEVRGPTP